MGRGVIGKTVLLAAAISCTASCGKAGNEDPALLPGAENAAALRQGTALGEKAADSVREWEVAMESITGPQNVTSVQATPVAEEYFAKQAGEYVIAYYPSWAQYDSSKLQVDGIDASMLTHIHYAFAETTENYVPFADDIAAHEDNLRALVRLRQQNPGLKLVLSVGGAGGDRYFAPMCAQDEGIAVFAGGCADFLEEYDFDGIDLDWEFPQTEQETAGFTRLIYCLRYHLDALGDRTGKHYSLSLAGAADVGMLRGIDYAAVGPYLDYVFIMGYNLYGPWNETAGFNAPLYAPGEQEAGDYGNGGAAPGRVYSLNAIVKTYLGGGLAANQLVLGLPFYGYVMPVAEAGNVGPGKAIDKNSTEETYVDCRTVFEKYLGNPAYTAGWDETAQSPYLDGEGKFISYEDERSIRVKCGLIGRYGLAGAGLWELSQDTEDFRLLGVVWETMEKLRGQEGNAVD
ncbi:MAG: hypothetical protein K2P87_02370 [Lachnospiraceae bacterium]|nr:hypothetical protein [Lachnospiraceae bacterium]